MVNLFFLFWFSSKFPGAFFFYRDICAEIFQGKNACGSKCLITQKMDDWNRVGPVILTHLKGHFFKACNSMDKQSGLTLKNSDY